MKTITVLPDFDRSDLRREYVAIYDEPIRNAIELRTTDDRKRQKRSGQGTAAISELADGPCRPDGQVICPDVSCAHLNERGR